MCGIAGYIGPSPLHDTTVQATLALMKRRGPDCQKSLSYHNGSQHVSLLHSRLNIIDLDDRADQPFVMGSLSMVFNGELYNYKELRKELEAEGFDFKTESDTEVLLRVLSVRGWRGLDRCEGMWAFALYDESDGSLTFCRDRFGEKPLYIARGSEGRFYFGSEVKFISAMMDRRLEINADHILRFLVNGYRALYKQRASFFTGVEEIAPGSLLRLDASGHETPWRYWMPSYEVNEDMSYEEAVAGSRERLIRSMEIRLRADVPLAFCMSGGVDSNALISIAKRVFDYDVHGFTITNTDPRYDETELALKSAAELGIRHTAIPSNFGDLLGRLRLMVAQHDAPVCTITMCLHWMIEEAMAEQGYKISISGTAADEMFTGYFDHHIAYLFDVREDSALLAKSRANWTKHIRPIVRNPYLQNPDLYFDTPGERRHLYLNNDEFAGYLERPWREPYIEANYRSGLLRNRMLNELFHEAVPISLREDDLNSMYFSIENRSPFLDRPLFDFTNSIPTRHLIQDGAAKSVLRDALRGITPAPVLDSRRKVGLNSPILEMLHLEDPSVRKALLADSPIYDYVQRSKIEDLLDRANLPNSESKFLFNFVSAKTFLDEYAG